MPPPYPTMFSGVNRKLQRAPAGKTAVAFINIGLHFNGSGK